MMASWNASCTINFQASVILIRVRRVRALTEYSYEYERYEILSIPSSSIAKRFEIKFQ
jgi:hypothetical protein